MGDNNVTREEAGNMDLLEDLVRDPILTKIEILMNLNREKEKTLVGLLEDYGIEEIALYLSDYLTLAALSLPGVETIRQEELYVSNAGKGQGFWTFFFGDQVRNSEVPLLTIDELHASFRWARRRNWLEFPPEVRKNVDAWANHQLLLVIRRNFLPKVHALKNGVRRWKIIHSGMEDTFGVERLIKRHEKSLQRLDAFEGRLRTHRAPECLRRQVKNEIETIGHILDVLKEGL